MKHTKGEKRVRVEMCREQKCFKCGESARYKHTYLLEGSRTNPTSNAYGKDDCSWCEDECVYACVEHSDLVKREHQPEGMRWCSTFTRNERFEHLFIYWEEEYEVNANLIASAPELLEALKYVDSVINSVGKYSNDVEWIKINLRAKVSKAISKAEIKEVNDGSQ